MLLLLLSRPAVREKKAANNNNNNNAPISTGTSAAQPIPAYGVTSPAGIPSYAKPGLTADQLKLPAGRKRKANQVTPDDSKGPPHTPNTVSPNNKANTGEPSVKKEKMDPNELMRQRTLLESMQKKKELAQTQPLAYFISCLGDALDVPEEEINAAIKLSNEDGKESLAKNSMMSSQVLSTAASGPKTTGGGGVTPTALLRTPQPFSAAKTPATHNAGSTKSVSGSSGANSTTEEADNDGRNSGLPLTPLWTGNVQAIAIKNAFQAIEAVKVADIQFLTPPEESKSLSILVTDNKKIKIKQESSKELPAIKEKPIDNLEEGIWDYDSVINSIGLDEGSLKTEFWTLSI